MPATTVGLMLAACALAVAAAAVAALIIKPALERRRRARQRAAFYPRVAGALAVNTGTWEQFVAAHPLDSVQEA